MKKIFLILMMAMAAVTVTAGDGPQYKFLSNRNGNAFAPRGNGGNGMELRMKGDASMRSAVIATPFRYSMEMMPVQGSGVRLVSSDVSIGEERQLRSVAGSPLSEPFGVRGRSVTPAIGGSAVSGALRRTGTREVTLGNGKLALSGSGIDEYQETGLIQPPKSYYEPVPVEDGVAVMLVLALLVALVKRFIG